MIGRAVFALCALAVATGASAANTAKKNDPNKVVCRTVEESGSRLKKTRACHTMAEWAEIRRQAKEQIDHIQNNRPASGQ